MQALMGTLTSPLETVLLLQLANPRIPGQRPIGTLMRPLRSLAERLVAEAARAKPDMIAKDFMVRIWKKFLEYKTRNCSNNWLRRAKFQKRGR